MQQSSLLQFATNGRKIRADIFLEEMDAAIPWGRFLGLICPKYYAKQDQRGRKRAAALVDDQRNQLDITVRFCVTFGVAMVVSAGLLFRHGWWLTVPLASLVLAWMSYRGAVASALAYAMGIRTATDLHRFALLRALHLPLPPDREAEKQTNALLSEFLRQGRPVDFHYDHPRET